MTWLRISDGFTQNSKIAQLSDRDFRVWMRTLCHCGNARDPSVDSVTKREVSGLTSARVSRFRTLGLLDQIGDGFEVHNWTMYLPKDEQNAARQAKFRSRQRNAESNARSNAPRNADVDAPGNASNGPSRAGTRGVPSRPVDQEQEPSLHPSVAKDPEPEPKLNGRQGDGWMDDESRITPADIQEAIQT